MLDNAWNPIDEFKVLDLFSGMGGLSLGFKMNGFRIIGVDKNVYVPEIYEYNNIGKAFIYDLNYQEDSRLYSEDYKIIIGGPPCRPWSALNIKKRGRLHPDYPLLRSFFKIVKRNKPFFYLLENVPLSKNDVLKESRILGDEYIIVYNIFRYSDWGAATRRRRLIVFGFRRDKKHLIRKFFQLLSSQKTKKPKTVREAFSVLKDKTDPEHVYPSLHTIWKYREKYSTNKYGWYVLKWDDPAPSFGNVMKTYILHPDSANGNARVISVREAMLIMGFPQNYRFPPKIGMSVKYQMISDAVSPIFSNAIAKALRKVLENEK